MLGYYNNPSAAANAILPDKFIRSSDQGYRDQNHQFYIVNRSKEINKYGAEQVIVRNIVPQLCVTCIIYQR